MILDYYQLQSDYQETSTEKQYKKPEIGLSLTDLFLYLQLEYITSRNLKTKVKVRRFLYQP